MSTAVIVMIVLLLVFLFMKVPVFIAVFGASAAYFVMTPSTNFSVFAQRAITGCEGISLLAIPFFVCAGALMNYTGVTKRIMDFCKVLTSRMHGGLAQVNVLLSTLMGGLSGSALADAAMEAKMLVPEMERGGFSKSFSAVVTAASSMITPLIPPGICLILYGCIANISIGKLFIAGIGPGVLLCVSMMLLVSFVSRKRGYGSISKERMTKKRFFGSLKPAFLPLLLPIIIIGGIRIGIFTATEAGSVACIYALFLGILFHELSFKDFLKAVQETLITTCTILLIVAAASTFSWILTKEQIPQRLTQWMVATIHNKWLFLIAVDIFLIIVGMFIEGNASMIILVPLFAPVAAAYEGQAAHRRRRHHPCAGCAGCRRTAGLGADRAKLPQPSRAGAGSKEVKTTMGALDGRVGLVTGASSGIGYAIANALAQAGARVYGISRSGGVKAGMPEIAAGVVHLRGDVTDREGMKRLIDEIGGREGIDFLVNDAGITQKHRAETFPMEAFERIMAVNVNSIFSLCQLCYPYLKASRYKGRIVNISSMAAHLGFTEVVPYCTSKAAVCGLTRGLAIEWANDNICVNSIAPGWFPSEMSRQVMTPERRAAILARMPVHAFGDTKDLGAMALFLIGDGAGYITGQDFAVDGGALAYGF